MNDEFYSKIFMMPYYHAPTFLMGIFCGLIYSDYLKERKQVESGNSLSTRFFSLIIQNALPRYVLYFIGLACIIGTVLWHTPFHRVPQDTSRVHQAAFGSIAFPLYILGLMMLLLPALVGRCQLFRFIYCSQSWTMVCQMAPGLQYTTAIIAIYYFMATQHQIQVTYYMFVYYFTGNIVFGVALY